MSSAYLPYMVTEMYCILFAGIIFFRLKSEIGNERELESLKWMIAAYVVMLATDLLWVFVENGPLRKLHALNGIANGISITAVAVGCYFWFQFLEFRLNPQKTPEQKTKWLIRIPLIVICALDLSSAFTGWIFYINADGRYTEGRFFWIQSAVTFTYLLVPTAQAVYMAVRTKYSKRRREYLTYVAFICVCFAVVAVQDKVETVPLFALSVFAVVLILFLTLYIDKEYALIRRERELTESRTAVMLSQIQPYFLYSTLAVIQTMCQDKAPEAAKTVVEFSDYLRGNMDSLRRKEPILFEREFQHTKNYLALEEKRFGDKLRVEYDIRADGFSLPALTLQPIVENAVQHGVSQREQGGTIRISTDETERGFTVTVADDGIGFDASQTKNDGRAHIGIANVRERLKTMCGGTLDIQSEPGVGTTTVITIPKERRLS